MIWLFLTIFSILVLYYHKKYKIGDLVAVYTDEEGESNLGTIIFVENGFFYKYIVHINVTGQNVEITFWKWLFGYMYKL